MRISLLLQLRYAHWELWPAKQGANYSMIRWSMKRGWVALEEKNFPVLYLINQKAWRVQISSCLLFFNNTKARKNCSHFRKRLFFLFTNSLRWTGRLIRNRTIKQRSLNMKFTKHHLTELFYSTLNSKTKKKPWRKRGWWDICRKLWRPPLALSSMTSW